MLVARVVARCPLLWFVVCCGLLSVCNARCLLVVVCRCRVLLSLGARYCWLCVVAVAYYCSVMLASVDRLFIARLLVDVCRCVVVRSCVAVVVGCAVLFAIR